MSAGVLLLALAGCGSQRAPDDAAGRDSTSPAPQSSTASGWRGCSADDLTGLEPTIEVDLDGSRGSEPVYLVSAGSGLPCAGGLVVRHGEQVSGTALGGTAMDAGTARVVRLEDTDRELLLLRQAPHPRGGFQIHLYGLGEDGLGEVTADGNPVVPFVATDGGAAPFTVECAPRGGIQTFTATTHKPPGIVLAWDVYRTVYALDGTTARKTSSELVKEAAADPLLRRDRPELFEPGGYFSDCIDRPGNAS